MNFEYFFENKLLTIIEKLECSQITKFLRFKNDMTLAAPKNNSGLLMNFGN